MDDPIVCRCNHGHFPYIFTKAWHGSIVTSSDREKIGGPGAERHLCVVKSSNRRQAWQVGGRWYSKRESLLRYHFMHFPHFTRFREDLQKP